MATKDPYQRLGRKDPRYRFDPKSTFSRRLQSHDRPVPKLEKFEEPDTPADQFSTEPRPEQ